MRSQLKVRWVLLLVAASGCPAPRAAEGPAFALSCHSASTATSRQVHCVRTDTRTGDVLRVDLAKLPQSNGPTASGLGPAGRFHTACATAASSEQADFYCVRLNTDTGELLLLNLGKLGQLPQ